MPWHKVVFSNYRDDLHPAAMLLNQFSSLYRDAALPDGVEIYFDQDPGGDKTYYFSPQASIVAGTLMQQYKATACPEKPNISKLIMVSL